MTLISNSGPSIPRLPDSEKRRRRLEYAVILAASAALAGGIYLEKNLYRFSVDVKLPSNLMVFTLINVNLLLLLLLLFFIIRNIIKIVFERRAKVTWSRLRTRLVAAFAAFSLVPTVLLFLLSTGMIKKSVESWFKSQVDTSMRSSVEVAQTYYRESQETALHFSQTSAEILQVEGILEGVDAGSLDARMQDMRRTFNLWALELYAPNFDLKTAAVAEGAPVDISRFAFPFGSHLLTVGALEQATLIETFGTQDVARAYSPVVSSLDGQTVIGYVVADVALEENLLSKMAAVSQAYDEYWRLRYLASPLKTSYIFTLIMAFAMVIMLSTWVGMYLAKGISEPIQLLVEATHEVSRGNLDVIVPPAGDDEIGRVIDSFNAMTSDLKASELNLQQANKALQERNNQVEASKRYIEIVLGSVAAGVVSFDREGRITTLNAIAAGLLKLRPEEAMGKNYRDIFPPEAMGLAREMMETLRLGNPSSQREWTLNSDEGVVNLLVNLTAMHAEDSSLLGAVLVFDDLSALVKAQRAAAWREVARRIAHEIKNPLTPIQLAAQRLRKRYLTKFEGGDEKIFDESTRVIIEQVEAMKVLVNEFTQFARMPQASLAPADLNSLVEEIEIFYQQAHKDVQFTFRKGNDLPRVNLDPEQIKRVVVNLLDNAVSAMENKGEITLRTHYNPDLHIATFEVRDTGPGIALEDRQRVFEPYFTTKKGGTGLGLAIVKKIMEDHHGYIRVHSNSPTGAVFVLEFPAGVERNREMA